MENLQQQEENTQHQTTQQPYEPPKATFIPMTLEERMAYCGKGAGNAGGGCFFGCK